MKNLLILLLALTGCATTQSSVEVRIEAAEETKPTCVAVLKVEVR